MRTVLRCVALGFALVAHATNAETGEDLTFKLCTPNNTVHGSFGSSAGVVKSISEFVNQRLQGAGIWTESHDGKVRNMFAINMTVEPSERRFYVLEAMYLKMVVLAPMVGKMLKPGNMTSQQMAPGVNLARTWAHMEFGQMGSEAELLAHVVKMTDRFIEAYHRAQRTESCRWLRGPGTN